MFLVEIYGDIPDSNNQPTGHVDWYVGSSHTQKIDADMSMERFLKAGYQPDKLRITQKKH